MGDLADDRRQYPRVQAGLLVRSRLLDPSELPLLASSLGKTDPVIPQLSMVKGRTVQLAAVNLSQGGISASGDLQLDSDLPWPRGADLVVEFDLEDGQPPVRAVAQVVRSVVDNGKHHMGLMFLLIADSAFTRIQDFVQKNLR